MPVGPLCETTVHILHRKKKDQNFRVQSFEEQIIPDLFHKINKSVWWTGRYSFSLAKSQLHAELYYMY